jgi:hypothetical protein
LADFNGDGLIDIAFSSYQASQTSLLTVLLGMSGGTFQYYPSFEINLTAAGSVFAQDVNGDGKLDLIADAAPPNIEVFFGNGDGTFSNLPIVLTNYFPGALEGVADFNQDGKVDLLIQYDHLMGISYGKGDGTFPTGHFFPGVSRGAVIGDLNDDGFPDLLTATVVGNLLIMPHTCY